MLTVQHYITLHSYLACQTDFVHEYSDSHVPEKLTHLHDTGSVNDVCFGQSSVKGDDSVENIHETLLCSSQKSLSKYAP
jgi:hypothetical protein